jgi:hypothetical protein
MWVCPAFAPDVEGTGFTLMATTANKNNKIVTRVITLTLQKYFIVASWVDGEKISAVAGVLRRLASC